MNYLYEHVYNFVCQCNIIFVKRFTNDKLIHLFKLLPVITILMIITLQQNYLSVFVCCNINDDHDYEFIDWLYHYACWLRRCKCCFIWCLVHFLWIQCIFLSLNFIFALLLFHSIANCISTSKIAYLINYFPIFQFILKPFLIPSLKIENISYYWLINQIINHVVCWKQHS